VTSPGKTAILSQEETNYILNLLGLNYGATPARAFGQLPPGRAESTAYASEGVWNNTVKMDLVDRVATAEYCALGILTISTSYGERLLLLDCQRLLEGGQRVMTTT
jgi:hypothetical protein